MTAKDVLIEGAEHNHKVVLLCIADYVKDGRDPSVWKDRLLAAEQAVEIARSLKDDNAEAKPNG